MTQRILIPASITLALLAAVGLAVFRLLQMPHETWNAERLTVAFSMLKGYALYYPSDAGPIEAHIYGPMNAIAFLPAAMFKTPTNAILAGSVISALWFFIPSALLIRTGSKSKSAWLAAVAIFGCVIHNTESMGRVSVVVHGDSVAIGLIACALILLLRRSYVAVAVCLSLAVWTKQSVLPVLFLFQLLALPRKAFWRQSVAIAVVFTVLSAALLLCFGWREVIFNMFVVPSHQPWQFGLAHGALLVGRECLIPALLLVMALALRNPQVNNLWIYPLAVAIALFPAAVLGWAKVGGAANNAAFPATFILIAACCALADCEIPRPWIGRPDAQFGGLALLGILALFVAWRAWDGDEHRRSRWSNVVHLYENPSETAFRYELEHPGECYFANDPLPALLASGKLYHFDYGVHDRRMAGFPPGPEHVRAWIPAARYLVYTPGAAPSGELRKLLPEYSEPVAVRGLVMFPALERGEMAVKR